MRRSFVYTLLGEPDLRFRLIAIALLTAIPFLAVSSEMEPCSAIESRVVLQATTSLVCNRWLYSCADIEERVCVDLVALSYEACPCNPMSAVDNADDLSDEDTNELIRATSKEFGACFSAEFSQMAKAHAVSEECIAHAMQGYTEARRQEARDALERRSE